MNSQYGQMRPSAVPVVSERSICASPSAPAVRPIDGCARFVGVSESGPTTSSTTLFELLTLEDFEQEYYAHETGSLAG